MINNSARLNRIVERYASYLEKNYSKKDPPRVWPVADLIIRRYMPRYSWLQRWVACLNIVEYWYAIAKRPFMSLPGETPELYRKQWRDFIGYDPNWDNDLMTKYTPSEANSKWPDIISDPDDPIWNEWELFSHYSRLFMVNKENHALHYWDPLDENWKHVITVDGSGE